MSDAGEPTPIAAWAAAHGFAPSDRRLHGETPLLRQGLVEVAADVHEGALDGRRAAVFELYIDAAGVPLVGDTGISSSAFTALLVELDAPSWPRVTIHPVEFGESSLLSRLVWHDDHRLRDLDPELDRRYRVRVADSTPAAAADRLAAGELAGWVLGQPTLVADVENNVDTGDSLLVAAPGGASADVLDRLADQAAWLAAFFEAAP
jgi:hypothetical protein